MPKWSSNLQKAVVEWLAAHPEVTRTALAERSGIDKAAISRLCSGEKDNLNGDSALALARVMGVSVEDLYEGRSRGSPTAAVGDIVFLPLERLNLNPINPRKAVENGALSELKESIAADGILQNLVVAPADKKGNHVVIAGNRRLRALLALADEGRWPRIAVDIPCKVLEGDEPRVRALALVENLQRVDLAPMEEAEAFAELVALDPQAWTTARIAETVHRTQRFVQQRLALATKLTAKAKKALAEGTISVEMARELVKAPMKRQVELLGDIENARERGWDEEISAGSLREQITEDWFPIERAAFDRTLYKGKIEQDDDTGERWFTDGKQFMELQRQAAQAKAAELRQQRAWVEVKDAGKNGHFHSYDYAASRAKDLSGAGAVVEISGIGELKVHDGLLRKQDTVAKSLAKGKSKGKSKAKGAALPVEPEPYTNALLVHARAVKSAALQDAVVRAAAADDGDAAMCLAIVGLLGCGAKIKMRDDMRTGFDPGRGAGQAVRMQALWAEILSGSDPAVTGKRLRRDDDVNTTAMRRNAETLAKGDTSIHAPWYDGPPPHAVWTWLQSLDRGRRVQIFATLVADRCGYFLAYQKPAPHHDAFDVAVAQHIGLDMTRKWTPDDTWIDGSRKARLEVLARAIALDPIPKSTTQLRAALKARLADPSPLPPAATWFPSEVRILDEASFKAVFHSPGARHSSDASDDAPTEDARQESRGPSS